jgi:REP element-mobilizing transposase RayT
MPRPLRLHVPGAMYHVTLRGNHRQNIFFTTEDRRILSELIAEVVTRFGARLHAYCFMTNHIHALIQVADAPLGRLMLRIAGRYARTVQAKLHTTGHLFEKRYYPVLVGVSGTACAGLPSSLTRFPGFPARRRAELEMETQIECFANSPERPLNVCPP